MASFNIGVKLGRFRWNRAGYAALMDSGTVQSLVSGRADAVAEAANGDSSLGAEGYQQQDYEAKSFAGTLTHGCVVRTKTDYARYAQARNKTLTKALHSAKGN